jgi:ABC-type transport system substrate-binding protein
VGERITDRLSDLAAREVSRRTVLKVAGGSTAAAILGTVAPRAVGARSRAVALAQEAPATPTGTLRIANPGEPNFLDPAMSLENYEFSIVRSVYEGLLGWNDDYSALVPELATEWSSNADATEWTFKLREGVTFHDGTPFDSAAVKGSIEHYDPATTNWGFLFGGLNAIETPDASTVVLKFDAPSPDIARNQVFVKMISPALLARSTEGGDATAQPVNQEASGGTGPYMWKGRQPGTSVTLVANPEYWDADHPPHFESVEFTSIADTDAALTALQAGNVDLLPRIAPLQLQRVEGDANLASSTVDSWLEIHLIFRTDQAPLDNVKVRQAIAHAIDRQAIIDDVLLGQATIATSLMPPGTYGRAEPTTTYPYDPDKARTLLAEAGYDGTEVKMASGNNAPFPLVGQAIAAQLQEVGINAVADAMEPGVAVNDTLISETPGHIILLSTYGWVNGGPFHYNVRTVVNHPHYTGEDVVSTVDAVNTTPDGDERLEVLANAQEVYAQQIPDFPLWYPKVSDAFAKRLKGYSAPVDAYQLDITDAYFSE